MHKLTFFFACLCFTACLFSCSDSEQTIDRLTANKWILYERIESPGQTDENKLFFKKSDEQMMLQFEGKQMTFTKEGIAAIGGWGLTNDQLTLGKEVYQLVKAGERVLVIQKDINGKPVKLQFAPEDCTCWKE